VGDALADVPVKMRRKEGAAAKKPPAVASKGLAARRREEAASAGLPAAVPKEVTFTLSETPAIGDDVVVFEGPDAGKVL